MLKIPGVYVEFKGDMSELKRDFRKVRILAKEAGTDISNGMRNAITPLVAQKAIANLYKDLSKLNRVSAVTSADMKKLGVSLDKDLLKNVKMTNSEFKALQRRLLNVKAEKQAERAIKNLGRSLKLTSLEMAKLRRKAGDTKGALREIGTGIKAGFSSAGKTIGAASLAMVALGYTVKRVSGAFWDAGLLYKRLVKTMEEITGSTAKATKELEYLRELSNKYGQDMYALLPAYKDFLAATIKTGVSLKDIHTIYNGVIKATSTLGLTSEDTYHALLAVQQMASKGMKGISQEITLQLSNVLPGAFGLLAKSAHVPEVAFRKMMKQGKLTMQTLVDFGQYLSDNFSGHVAKAVSASNQFSQAWMDLKIKAGKTGFIESASKALENLTEAFKDPEVIRGMQTMATLLGKILETASKIPKGIGKFTPPDITTQIKNAQTRLEELNKASKFMQWTKALTMNPLQPAPFNSSKAEIAALIRRITLLKQLKTVQDQAFTEKNNRAYLKTLGADPSPLPHSEDTIAQKKYGKLLAALAKQRESAQKTYVDSWAFAYKDKDAVQARSIQASIDLERAAIKEGVASAGKYVDSWRLKAKDMESVTERSTKMMYDNNKSAVTDIQKAFDGWASGFSSTLNDMLWNSDTTFKDIGKSFAKMLTQMVIQKEIAEPFMTFGGNAIKGAGNFLSSFFASAQGNAFSQAGLVPYAHGGAFTNKIVDQPTMFAYGGGFGVMGEKEPEAIMPLKRTKSGDLGIATDGNNNAPVVQINVINNTGTDADVKKQQPKWDGEKWVIGVVLDAIHRNSGFRSNLKSAVVG